MAEPTQEQIDAAAAELYGHFTENRVAGWGDIGTTQRGRYRLAARDALRAAEGARRG